MRKNFVSQPLQILYLLTGIHMPEPHPRIWVSSRRPSEALCLWDPVHPATTVQDSGCEWNQVDTLVRAVIEIENKAVWILK